MLVGGLRRGELTIFAARRGSGKSVLFPTGDAPHDVVQDKDDTPND